MRRLVALAAAILVAAPLLPVSAQVTLADVEEARRELRRVSESLATQASRYDAAVAREAILHDRLDRMLVELAARERDLVVARRIALERAAEMYMSAGAPTSSLVSSGDITVFPARLVYLETVSLTDRDALNTLEMTRRDYEQQRTLVDEALTEQSALVAEMDDLLEVIYAELEQANDRYQAVKAQWDAQEAERIRREEEERRRREFLATSTTTTSTTAPNPGAPPTTAPPTTTPPTTQPPPSAPSQPAGTRVCPVDGAHIFTDTWGEPRSGGRTHTGQDLMAAHGTPVVAIEAGRVYQVNWHWAGGNQLYILGESGGLWFYAHLASAAIVPGGARVEAGQRVGFVGSTGNAISTHLHFGWYPGGSLFGPLANPYTILRSVC
jgi:peptidoglycan LD-endopeptidase LytH